MSRNRIVRALVVSIILVGGLWLLWALGVLSNTNPVFYFFYPALVIALTLTPNAHDLNGVVWFCSMFFQVFLVTLLSLNIFGSIKNSRGS